MRVMLQSGIRCRQLRARREEVWGLGGNAEAAAPEPMLLGASEIALNDHIL